MEEVISFLIKVGIGVIVALLFGLVVFVHELGHFLAARWLGFQVQAFAIGFGPALLKWKRGETEYRINIIPLGGYCALPQLDPSGMEKMQGEHGDEEKTEKPLQDIAAWKRIVVALAGPAGNILLALFVAWLIYAFAPTKATGALGTEIAHVEETTEAWEAGLREGQTVVQVGKRPVKTWYDFKIESHLAANVGELIALTVKEADGTERILEVPLIEEEGLRYVEGVYPVGLTRCEITSIEVDGPADKAGIMLKDQVVSINEKLVWSSQSFIDTIAKNSGVPVRVTVLRNEQKVDLEITPEFDAEMKRARIGVSLQGALWTPPWMRHRVPKDQVLWDAGSVYRALDGLVAPKVQGESGRVAKSIGGPVTLLEMLWMSVNAGFWICLGMVRLICVNLAVINLLPFPVLDGGHICFALWEIITRRKPNAKVVGVLVNIFAFLLIGLMLTLVFKDFWGIGKRALKNKDATVVEEVVAPEEPEEVEPELQD